MGKRLEDLQLTDDPIRPLAPIDPRDTDWYRFSKDIDDLLATGHYTWAESTLTDIQATVERIHQVTEGQRRAVRNIEAASGPGGRGSRWGSRRYEGFR